MKLDVINNSRSRPWYAEGLEFSCTQSGNCCTGGPGYVWISREEIRRLAGHLGLTERQVIDRYCREINGQYSLNENRNDQGNYDCVFLKEVPAEPSSGSSEVAHSHRTCAIYPVRPLQCRTWPFWEGTLSDKEAWDRAAHRCPGMNQGRHYTAEEIDALRRAKDWPN
jgi:uncharacterized protein